MQRKVIGVAVALGFALVVSQAMAQNDKGTSAEGKVGAAADAGGALNGPNVNNPNAANPNANNPTTTNPNATNPDNNNPLNNNPNVTNPSNPGPNLEVKGRADTGVDLRTDQPGERTTNQGRRDERSDAERNREPNARSGERGNRDDIQWRYRFYNGVWWYWLPDNRWVYWSNNAWQDYNPSTVDYQYEYDRFGRPIRYRAGYRGTNAENRTDLGRLDANKRDADNIRRDTDGTRRDTDPSRLDRDTRSGKDANRTEHDTHSDKDANRTDAPHPDKDANRTERDRETSKPGDKRSEESSKIISGDSKPEETKPRK